MKTITEARIVKTKPIARFIAANKAFVKVLDNERPEWPIVHTFLLVCMGGGEVPMQDIEKQLDMGQATVSRNVAKLADGITPNEPGARLVEAYEDPFYRRRKIVRLTEKGRRFAESLNDLMEG
jgi:DNA-binding MarR family transcriptional regulator